MPRSQELVNATATSDFWRNASAAEVVVNTNSTQIEVLQPKYSSWQWIATQILVWLLASVELYMLVCLLLYERNFLNKEPRRSSGAAESQLSDSNPSRKVAARRCKADKSQTTKVWIRRLTILACASALLKCLSNEIDLFLGTRSQTACQVFGVIAVCGYGGSLFFVMLILWLRQSAVQNHKALTGLPGKRIRIFCSRFLLALMLLLFGVLFALNFATMRLKPGPWGCLFDDLGELSQSARSSSGLIFTAVFQPAFAALLLYPFLKKLPKTDDRRLPAVKRVRLVIKRTLISLAVIVASDVCSIVASFYMEAMPVVWLAAVYDLNAFVGVVSLVCSYQDWRRRMRLDRLRTPASLSKDASSAPPASM